MLNVYIYALSDPKTNQIRYIGKSNNPQDRYSNHYNSSRDKNTHKRNWINSLRKDGLRPELIILDEVPKINWQYWEKFYISLFKSWGFNLVNYTGGGDGSTFANSGSFKKGNIPHNKGVPCKKETKQKIRDGYIPNKGSYKPIIKMDLNYQILSKYDCISDAVRESNGLFLMSKISECCNLKRIKHQGFIWRWDDGKEIIKRNKKNKSGKVVIQYDENMNEIRRFPSVMEASNYIGLYPPNISFCCKNTNRRAGGYYWRQNNMM